MKPANKKYLADARRAAYKGDVDILRMTLSFNHDYSQRTQQLPVPNEKLVCNMSILDMAVIGRKPFSCSKLIFKHYRDNQDMLEKLFQQDGKHSSLHLACQKQKKGSVLRKIINLYAKYGFKADRKAEHNMSTIAWLLDDDGQCKDPREPLVALLEHSADPSCRVDYKGVRTLPEDNGNEGPWAKDTDIREHVIEILHKARKQKSKACGKLAHHKFFETLKESLANNSDENAKSYLENIADMREKMRSANGGDSEVYFGWGKMLELKKETHKTQRQREAIEEEYRFNDKDCESCMRRECGKYKTRKLRPRIKRKVPNLENENDDCLVKQEPRDSQSSKVENGQPIGILEQLANQLEESSQNVENEPIANLTEGQTTDEVNSKLAKVNLKDKPEEEKQKSENKNLPKPSVPSELISIDETPDDKNKNTETKSVIENLKTKKQIDERRKRLETIEVASLSSESDNNIERKATSATPGKIQEESMLSDIPDNKEADGSNMIVSLKTTSGETGQGASVTAELVDLDDLPLDSNHHFDEKSSEQVVNTSVNSPAASNTSLPEVIDLCDSDDTSSKKAKLPKLAHETRVCRAINCAQHPSLRCSSCKVYYCSRKCQVKDWKRHKKECKKLKEMQLGSNSSFENTSIISQSSRTVASSEQPVEISVIDSNDEVIEEISKESSMSFIKQSVNFSQSTSKNRPRNTVTNTVIVLPAYHTPAPKPTGPAILSSRYSLNKISNRALATIKVDVNKKRTQSESGLPESKKIRLDLTDENNSVDQYDFMRDAQNFLKTTEELSERNKKYPVQLRELTVTMKELKGNVQQFKSKIFR